MAHLGDYKKGLNKISGVVSKGVGFLRGLRAKSKAAEEGLASKIRISPMAGILVPRIAFRYIDQAVPLTELHKAWQSGGLTAMVKFAKGIVSKQSRASELMPHVRDYVDRMIKTFSP